MVAFTEMLESLNQTWREQPRHVRVLAARYYVGADTAADLRRMAEPMHVYREQLMAPVLTTQQAEYIIKMR